MELPSKFLEPTASNTRPKNKTYKLNAMDKSTDEENLTQALQTDNKTS